MGGDAGEEGVELWGQGCQKIGLGRMEGRFGEEFEVLGAESVWKFRRCIVMCRGGVFVCCGWTHACCLQDLPQAGEIIDAVVEDGDAGGEESIGGSKR